MQSCTQPWLLVSLWAQDDRHPKCQRGPQMAVEGGPRFTAPGPKQRHNWGPGLTMIGAQQLPTLGPIVLGYCSGPGTVRCQRRVLGPISWRPGPWLPYLRIKRCQPRVPNVTRGIFRAWPGNNKSPARVISWNGRTPPNVIRRSFFCFPHVGCDEL